MIRPEALADAIREESDDLTFEQSVEVAHAVAKRLRASGFEVARIAP